MRIEQDDPGADRASCARVRYSVPCVPSPGTAHSLLPDPRDDLAIGHALVFALLGDVPPELWNRFGTKILPKLKAGSELKIGINFSVVVTKALTPTMEAEIKQILSDLGLSEKVKIE